ncbi:MAG: hypothetical protein B1H11_12490 [Desulfobacteraceae bacterium 4484_190.1]|nr:MAG: hypothetical protein B1H11_12490 [Desulfobacteraceae bacterium 4484_190.1]
MFFPNHTRAFLVHGQATVVIFGVECPPSVAVRMGQVDEKLGLLLAVPAHLRHSREGPAFFWP